MIYYLVIGDDMDPVWVCEECLDSEKYRECDVVDRKGNKYGDRECEECGCVE